MKAIAELPVNRLSAQDLLLPAQELLIVTHIKPDGDAIGSSLALANALSNRGKVCRVACADPVPPSYSFLHGATGIMSGPGQLSGTSPNVIVTVDCGSTSQLGSVYTHNSELFASVPLLNIDHHATNAGYGSVNVIDTKAAAVAETIYLLLSAWGDPVSPDIATCLLFGIVTDTQGFRTLSTTFRTLSLASELMQCGGDLAAVNDAAFRHKPLSTLKLWGQVFDNARCEGPIVWSRITNYMMNECGASEYETESAINFLADVEGADIAILLKETRGGSIRVSLRSTPELDVGEIAARLGGGGHRQAAGCTLPGPIDQAEEHLLMVIRSQLASRHEIADQGNF